MGIKKEAPVFVLLRANAHAQCMTGASLRFDLAHIIEIKGFIWLDDQLVLPVFFNVKGVPLVRVGQKFVFWMLRYIKLITEKRSNASKLQNTFAAVHDSKFILRHQFFATMSSDELKKQVTIKEIYLS